MKGDEGVEVIEKRTDFTLLIDLRNCDRQSEEVCFVNAPLSVNDTLTPSHHGIDKIFSYEATPKKIRIGNFRRLEYAVYRGYGRFPISIQAN